MYYVSTNKQDLDSYNEHVSVGENYNGTTTHWANVIEHPNETDFAIKKHEKYDSDLTEVDSLSEDWFESKDI
jgi:hypothetical protein